MSFTTDPNARQRLITGLRDLADYLVSHPALAVPAHGTEIRLSAASADDDGCAQVDRFARQLGVPVLDNLDHSGHYEAVRVFGPVSYRMAAISQAAMARYHSPDTWT